MGVAVHVLGQVVYGESLYFPLNFAGNLKLYKKINLQIIKKMDILSLPILLGWL